MDLKHYSPAMMEGAQVLTGSIGAETILAVDIATGAVGTAELADLAVTAGKIGALAVGTAAIANQAVTAGKIVTGGVGTAQLADGAVTPAKVEEDLLRYVDVQLTNAQILNLATVPVTIIAAPGANKAIIVHKILLVADSSGGAYAEPSAPDDMVLEYADGVDITGDIDATGFLTTADVQVRTYGVLDTVVVPDVDAVVRLLNTGTDYTGGNAANTLSVRVWYSVVPTVAFT